MFVRLFVFSYPGLVADSESQVEIWSSRLKERAQCQNFVLPVFRSDCATQIWSEKLANRWTRLTSPEKKGSQTDVRGSQRASKVASPYGGDGKLKLAQKRTRNAEMNCHGEKAANYSQERNFAQMKATGVSKAREEDNAIIQVKKKIQKDDSKTERRR